MKENIDKIPGMGIKEKLSRFLDRRFPGRIKPQTRFDLLNRIRAAEPGHEDRVQAEVNRELRQKGERHIDPIEMEDLDQAEQMHERAMERLRKQQEKG